MTTEVVRTPSAVLQDILLAWHRQVHGLDSAVRDVARLKAEFDQSIVSYCRQKLPEEIMSTPLYPKEKA